jgi:hypothetical protein
VTGGNVSGRFGEGLSIACRPSSTAVSAAPSKTLIFIFARLGHRTEIDKREDFHVTVRSVGDGHRPRRVHAKGIATRSNMRAWRAIAPKVSGQCSAIPSLSRVEAFQAT